jgi:hypothetical protein
MFAMGNLAYALRANGEGKLQSSVLVDACTTVQAAMEDSSDKVCIFCFVYVMIITGFLKS